MQDLIQEGDLVLLCSNDGKNFLIEVNKKTFQTHKDSFDLSGLFGKPWGVALKGKRGEICYALRPSIYDYLMKIKRVTQIVYPKDIGYILLKLDIAPGKIVLECGTGSGSILLAMAYAVGEKGCVITYERESRFQRVAQENVRRLGLEKRIIFKGEAAGKFDEKEAVDAVFLDVKAPWELLRAAWAALKGGAPLGILLPTTNQVSETLKHLQRFPFVKTEVVELMIRFYKINPERLRPEDRMTGHTGYLIFTHKVI